MIKGKIERLDRNGLIGWVAITDDAADKPQVEIIVDGEVVGRCRATRPRPDVEALGWGDGLCGVYMPIPDSVTDDQLERARIRFVGTELYLETPAKPQPIAISETREPKVSGHSPVFIVGSPRLGQRDMTPTPKGDSTRPTRSRGGGFLHSRGAADESSPRREP